MAISINLQGNPDAEGNPYIADVGKQASDAVIISSGTHGSVVYQIARKDRSPLDGINRTSIYLNIPENFATSELIRSVTAHNLSIILPLRTEFQVRVSKDGGRKFGNGVGNSYDNSKWITFKTRDKTYALPDSTTELRTSSATSATGETVTVNNYGKATVSYTGRGATVTNDDLQANDVTVNRAARAGDPRSRGWYIRNKTQINATATGATVTKIS